MDSGLVKINYNSQHLNIFKFREVFRITFNNPCVDLYGYVTYATCVDIRSDLCVFLFFHHRPDCFTAQYKQVRLC